MMKLFVLMAIVQLGFAVGAGQPTHMPTASPPTNTPTPAPTPPPTAPTPSPTRSLPVDKDVAIAELFNADVGCEVIPAQKGGNNCAHPLLGALCPATCGDDATTVADFSIDNDDIVKVAFGGTCKQLIDTSAGGQCFSPSGRKYTAVGALCPVTCKVPLTLPACKCMPTEWKETTHGAWCPSTTTTLAGCPEADCSAGTEDAWGYVCAVGSASLRAE